MAVRQNIPITEIWARSDWSNFDTYQSTTGALVMGRQPDPTNGFNFGLSTQRHIDVRSFIEGAWTTTGGGVIQTGSLGSSLNNWQGAIITAPAGTTTYTSQYTTPIDLTVLGSSTQLTLALPGFPVGSVDINNSFVELSSDGFNTQICNLAWAASTPQPGAGNTTLIWPYASLTGCDLTKITGVRIVITATANCTIYMAALRLLDLAWVQSNVDFDSIDHRLVPAIPINGAVSTLPVPNNQSMPILLRSADISGSDDPTPIDSEIGFILYTGSQTQNNSFSLFLRENSTAFITQLDLQGSTQSSLTGRPQPASGISEKVPRTMSDLDKLSMDSLGTQSMLDLESLNDPVFTQWIRFEIQWGTSNQIAITNSSAPANGYQYSMSLANQTAYLVICRLVGTSAQMQIYNVNQTTMAMGSLVFDTTVIPDIFSFPRLKGRVGFQAILQDGDTYIGPIRPRSLVFAEYKSNPFASITPVKGAQLFVNNADDIELLSSWSPLADANGNTPMIAPDPVQLLPGVSTPSTKVTITNPSTSLVTPQGVQTNMMTPPGDPISGITDFDSLHIEFYVWIPSAAVNGGTLNNNRILTAALISDSGAVLPVNLPDIDPDQWEHVSLFRPIPAPYPQSGLYKLVLYYQGTTPTNWWISGNASAHEHQIIWEGRSVVSDPWQSNNAPWTIFHETVNSSTSGILFTEQGNQLQLRGRAKQQGAYVLSAPKMIPIYAELGRLVWPEDAFVSAGNPTVIITSSNVGRTYTFNGTTSTSPNGTITNYHWSFGDGTFGAGSVIKHTFPSWVQSGTQYIVNLTVIDKAGISALNSTIVTLP